MRRLRFGAGLALALIVFTAQAYPLNNFDDGLASAPSRAYRTDPRLGSYRKQAETEAFVSDGQERWHWSATLMHLLGNMTLRVGGSTIVQGALGVGTDNPTTAVHVTGTISTNILAVQTGIAIGSVSTPARALHVGGTLSVSGASTFLSSLTLANAAALLTPDGTSAAPFIAPASETGNGLYRQAASFLGVSQNLHVLGALHVQAGFVQGVHVVTVAAEGTVAANIEILTGDRAVYLIDCNDGNGCTMQLGTTAPATTVATGAMTEIINSTPSATTLTVQDVTNVQHTAAAFTMGTGDVITFRLVTNRNNVRIWVERGRSDN